MAELELQDGEQTIDNWTLNFRPVSGGRFTGKFYVTNRRVLFDALQDNSSLLAALSDRSFASHGILSVDFADIKEVVSEKSFFRKSIILHIGEGEQLRFDYGMLSVDKIVETLKKQLDAARSAGGDPVG
jgi:hypothetical protein